MVGLGNGNIPIYTFQKIANDALVDYVYYTVQNGKPQTLKTNMVKVAENEYETNEYLLKYSPINRFERKYIKEWAEESRNTRITYPLVRNEWNSMW